MGERTQLEKQTFGKLQLENGQILTEDRVDWAIQRFIETQNYFELIQEVLDRARDRQATQYSKFEAAIDYQVFFTDQGVEKRKEKIKLRVFSTKMQKENNNISSNQQPLTEEAERCLRMLQVHNSKVDKIRTGYTTYCELRQQAIQEGITYEELKERLDQEDEGAAVKKVKSAKVGKKGSIAAAKKKFAAKSRDVGVLIKVKDDEGKIIEFEQDDTLIVAPVKKKKVKAKTVRAGTELNEAAMTGAIIDAEDTLAMIKNALKSGSGNIAKEMQSIDADEPKVKKPKKVTSVKKKEKMPKLEENTEYEEAKDQNIEPEMEDFQVSGDLESTDAANKRAGGKKAKKAKKAKKKVKESVDSISRFFNDYGESPHLQAIEMSYLMYLQA